MIAAGNGLRNKRMCGCAVCVRQRTAADHVEACSSQIVGHARWCEDVPKTRLVYCSTLGRWMIEDLKAIGEQENIVKMLEDEQ